MNAKLVLLVVLSCFVVCRFAHAQDAPPVEYGEDVFPPSYIFNEKENLRLTKGGVNTGRYAQEYICLADDFHDRTGACAELPPNEEIPDGFPVYLYDRNTTAVWSARDDEWKLRSGSLAKTTQGVKRTRFVKRTPGQGTHLSMVTVNAAGGDILSIAGAATSRIPAIAGGDEGQMAASFVMRDWDHHNPEGATDRAVKVGDTTFKTTVKRPNIDLHDDYLAPRSLLVWKFAPTVEFDLKAQFAGENPERQSTLGEGMAWHLEQPLAFDALPESRYSPRFGLYHTDYCLTLDATLHSGGQYAYLRVAKFVDAQTVVTSYHSQGYDVGAPSNNYVNGYPVIDYARRDGVTRGHVIPCSFVESYDSATSTVTVLPQVNVQVGRNWGYVSPTQGAGFQQGYKVVFDSRMGTAQRSNGYWAANKQGPEQRKQGRSFVVSGPWESALWNGGADVTVQDERHGIEQDAYQVMKLNGPTSGWGGRINVWYPNPHLTYKHTNLMIPLVDGDAVFGVVTRGNAAPVGACDEPGAQLYYSLDEDRYYGCKADKTWKRLRGLH